MLADDILSWSAADIAALYRSKRVSPVEVVTATFDRIDRLDRLYNAFVVIDREGALRDALASEERWRRGEPSGTPRWIARNGQGPRSGEGDANAAWLAHDQSGTERGRRSAGCANASARRRFLGEDNDVGVRLEGGHGQSTHGSNSQSMGCALHIRREQRWRRSRGGIGPGNTASGDRWRRLHPHSRELLWSVRL